MRVERRAYFLLGDILACATIGAVTGLLSAAIVGEGWNIVLGMVVSMVVGMSVSLVLGFALFYWLFGAMEVMVPTTLTGMAAGMGIGMAAAMAPIDVITGAEFGAVIGCAILGLTYLANALISGRSAGWTA